MMISPSYVLGSISYGANVEVDESMAEQCEEVLKNAFSRNGYKLIGSVSNRKLMSEIQFSLDRQSISVPMRFFAAS